MARPMSKRRLASSFSEILAIALFLLCSGQLSAQQSGTQGQETSSPVRRVTVSWGEVSGASGYEVLIRPLGGDVTVDQRTDKTSVIVALRPGTYQVRVVTFNIFKKPASESPWRNLDVVQVSRPRVTRVVPQTLYSGVPSASLTIDGSHYLPETTVEIIDKGRTVATPHIDRIMDNQLSTHVDLRSVPPGKYDLKIVNPENVSVVVHDALEVLRRTKPSLTSLSISYGYNDRVYRAVTVKGGGFSNNTAFFLQSKKSRIDIPGVVVESPSTARVDLNLSNAVPGAYSLVAANPGGLTATMLHALSVDKIALPRFEHMSPSSFTIGRSKGTFELAAKDMIPQTQVFLRKGGSLIPVEALPPAASSESAQPGSSTEVKRFRIYLSTVAPGTYDLVIKNSQYLGTTVNGLVRIRPEPVPSLTSSSITHAYDTMAYTNVVLKGEHLESRYQVALKFGGVQHDLVTRFVSSSELEVDADFRGMAPGRYTLVVQDPSGTTVASLPGGINVTPPPPPPPPLFVHQAYYTILAGYAYQLQQSQIFSGSVGNSEKGGDFSSAVPLGAKFFPGAPIIRDAGLELDAAYSYFASPPTGSSVTVGLGLTDIGLGLYYRSPFNFPLNAVLRAGYGISFTKYQVSGSLINSTGTSTDFYYRFGAGLQLDLGKYVVIEAGAKWTRTLYPVASLDALGFVVRGGVRLGG